MAQAIVHRGPDEDGFLERPGIALASRRLSIVGLLDGRQPIFNETNTIGVVFNGELFEYPEQKAKLEARGHTFRTHADTELIPHLWEEFGEGIFDHLRGQFAFGLYDEPNRKLVLGRDPFGICPLFWTRITRDGGDWLLFASEIKALLSSGWVRAMPDPRGLDNIFTFLAVPGPLTCFDGVQLLLPGHRMVIDLNRPQLSPKAFWTLDYPEPGHEDPDRDPKSLTDRFEKVVMRAVEKRLRADVPVVSYLSGGVDSSVIVAMASKALGRPIPTFTIQITHPGLDETVEAAKVSTHIGAHPVVVKVGDSEVMNTYPELIRAAESPVVDTSCAALLLLAREVHAKGYKVALTGEGADEWFAGYPWFKVHRLLGLMDVIPGLSLRMRRLFLALTGTPRYPMKILNRTIAAAGGYNAFMDFYGMMSTSRLRFFGARMLDQMTDHVPYADLSPDLDRVRKWHTLNKGLYWGTRVHLSGMLLGMKGDRVAMNSSVETRYPFLDEDVYRFAAAVHPRFKYRGLFGDKYILRMMAERYLPKEIAWRRKAMFRAPFDSFFRGKVPAFVDQLLSAESLKRTEYFDGEAVANWRRRILEMRPNSLRRTAAEMGLVAVFSTQLWHHTYMGGGLADLPTFTIGDRAAA
jgi:asparagine synthase (glutamine-hydrolysing)